VFVLHPFLSLSLSLFPLLALDLSRADSGFLLLTSGLRRFSCLWGNSTDLSLLIDMSEEDIKKLQSTGGDALAATEQNILGVRPHFSLQSLLHFLPARPVSWG
jgi:hypothetical protein